jgi:methionyl-tRNA synthetase
LVEKYGADPIRYYFLRYGPIVEDSDFSEDHFKVVYNADLANGLGNTVARLAKLAKLAEKSNISFPVNMEEKDILDQELVQYFNEFRVDLAAQYIWSKLSDLDRHINENAPWGVDDVDRLKNILDYEIKELCLIAKKCEPFMPETSEKILKIFSTENVTAPEPLFPRL